MIDDIYNQQDMIDDALQPLIWCDKLAVYRRKVTNVSPALVLVGNDGIVVACDRREMAQAGGLDYHRDDVTKLFRIAQNGVVLSVGNSVGFANWLLHTYNTVVSPSLNEDNTSDACISFSQFLKKEYEVYTKDVNPSWLVLSENLLEFVITGYSKDGQPQIVRFNNLGRHLPFAPELLDEPYYFSGKNSAAYYITRKVSLKRPVSTIGVDLLKQMAVYIITETSRVDDHVGLPIDMAVVTKNVAMLSTDEVNQIEITPEFVGLLS